MRKLFLLINFLNYIFLCGCSSHIEGTYIVDAYYNSLLEIRSDGTYSFCFPDALGLGNSEFLHQEGLWEIKSDSIISLTSINLPQTDDILQVDENKMESLGSDSVLFQFEIIDTIGNKNLNIVPEFSLGKVQLSSNSFEYIRGQATDFYFLWKSQDREYFILTDIGGDLSPYSIKNKSSNVFKIRYKLNDQDKLTFPQYFFQEHLLIVGDSLLLDGTFLFRKTSEDNLHKKCQ